MLVAFGKANWLDKARQQPHKVRMVLEKLRTDGLAAAFEAVKSKLRPALGAALLQRRGRARGGAGVDAVLITAP